MPLSQLETWYFCLRCDLVMLTIVTTRGSQNGVKQETAKMSAGLQINS